MVRDTYSPERFFETFRICRETFNFILVNVYDELLKKTLIEESISPDCRLAITIFKFSRGCLLYTSPSPRDKRQSRMPSSA